MLHQKTLFIFIAFVLATMLSKPAQAEYTVDFDIERAVNQAYDRIASVVTRSQPIFNSPLDPTSRLSARYSSSHAIVIGASNYEVETGWRVLPGVETDIAEVSAVLKKNGFNVQTVSDPNSTELRDALFQFVFDHGYDPDARLLFYFAGHGHTMPIHDGREIGYLVPIDAPVPNLDDSLQSREFRKLAFSMEYINVLARLIESKHVLFVFDSCFSGTIFSQLRSSPTSVINSEDLDKPVRYFITSGKQGEEVPDESVFRKYFVRALSDTIVDEDGDQIVLAEQLAAYLLMSVTADRRSAQTPQFGYLQDPHLTGGSFAFEIDSKLSPVDQPSEAVVLAEGSIADTDSSVLMRGASDQYSPEIFDNTLPPLERVLRNADSMVTQFSGDGAEYGEHSWCEASDVENLMLGVDDSRLIWYLFSRSGLPYTRETVRAVEGECLPYGHPSNHYITTAEMAANDSPMRAAFEECDKSRPRVGDILVYRDQQRDYGSAFLVVDPQNRIAWGSHGWDGSRFLNSEAVLDTGIEYQQIKVKQSWDRWDRASQTVQKCWRHKAFEQPVVNRASKGDDCECAQAR